MASAGLGASDFFNYIVSVVSIQIQNVGASHFLEGESDYCKMAESHPDLIEVVQQQTTILRG